MTKAAKEKLRKSRAAQQAENYAINKYIRELEASLKAAGVRENKLKSELENLKQELKQTRSELKRAKATNKELRAKTGDLIQKFDNKIKKLNKPSTPKISGKTDGSRTSSITRDKFGNVSITVEKRPHRTKEEWLSENKSNFVNQFLTRLENDFPNANPKHMEQLKVNLDTLDAASIDAILSAVDEDFRTQYYESEALASYQGKGKEEFLDSLFAAFGIGE